MKYPYLIECKSDERTQEAFAEYLVAEKDFIFEKLKETGAILFRGFGVDTKEAFEKSIMGLKPNLREYLGGDSPRDKVGGNVYTSTSYPPEETISMHNEMSYSNGYPGFIFFYCEVEPKVGGETPIVDCKDLINKLPADIVEKFRTRKLKYIMNLHDGLGLGKPWKEVYQVSTQEEVETLLDRPHVSYKWKDNGLLQVEETVNPIQVHPETGDEIFFSQADQWHPTGLKPEILESLKEIMPVDDFYHNCRYGDDTEIDEGDLEKIREVVNNERVLFKWQKNDLLMLDNLRSMHGRCPFEGERSILVAMS